VKNNNPLLTGILSGLFLVSLGLLSAPNVGAEGVQAQQWEITADKLTRYEDPPSVIAEGNVVLEKTE